MIVVGIDCGSQNTRGVLLRNGEPVAKAQVLTEFDANIAATRVLRQLFIDASVTDPSEVKEIAVTGGGKDLIDFASLEVSESNAASHGTHFYFPEADAVIDMGAEGSRAVKINPNGSAFSYETNDKCASGAGVFIENMARCLEVTIEEMGPLSLKHTKEEPMNVQCVVFAESEVISMIHRNETAENIAYSIHAGVVNRMMSMIKRLGSAGKYVFIGGPSLNEGLIQCLRQAVDGEIIVNTEHSRYISALGAALVAENRTAGTEG